MEPPNNGSGSKSPEYRAIDEFISDSELMLNNTLADDQIKDLMEDAGYTAATINTKLTELVTLRGLNEKQAQEYGEQDEATTTFHSTKDAYHQTYIDHLALARLALRNHADAGRALGLDGKRKVTHSGYIGQGLLFYNNAALTDKPYAAALAGKGVNATKLAAGTAHFEDLQTRLEKQQKETGEAQQATAARDALYDDLDDWLSEYRATAKIILRPYPDLSEELGILDRSEGDTPPPSPGGGGQD